MAEQPKLTVVSEASELYNLSRGPETTHDRVRRLQQEARLLAREEVETLERQLVAVADMARGIARGGDAYPIGIREMAERLAADLPARAASLQALVERAFGEG